MSLSSGGARSGKHFHSCPFDNSWHPQTCYLIVLDTKWKRVCSELRVPVVQKTLGLKTGAIFRLSVKMGPGWIVEKGHRFNLHPSLHPWLHMAISGQLQVSDDPGWNIILVLVIVSFLLIITGCIDDFWPDSPWWYQRSLRRHWIIYSQERVCGDGFPNIKTSTPILGSHLGKHYLMVSSTSPAAPSSYHQHQPLEDEESIKNTTSSICHTMVSIMWITAFFINSDHCSVISLFEIVLSKMMIRYFWY